MKTRSLLLTALALVAFATNGSAADSDAPRPNILLAFADDWGCQASAYAKLNPGGISDVVHTPNFDKVAGEGVLFLNAHVNAPSCTPCRSSLLSGQHFWRTGRGAILRGAVWDSSIPSWPLLLHDGGYHIGQTHKVWSPGTPVDAPYGENKYAYEKAGKKINSFSQNATKLVESGQSVEEAKAALLEETRANFKAFLADQKEGQPFCYWYGPTNVHRKWIRGSGKALWNINPDDLKGKMPPFLPDVPEVREDLADYMGEAEAFDAQLGILIEELKASGQYDNTIIAVSGDHGPAGFAHGKCNLYDFGTHVALAIAGPGVKGGRVVEDFVSIPDLAPTFLEAGQVAIPDVMTAKTLWPTLESDKEGLVDSSRTAIYAGRERHVEMAREGFLPYPQRVVRTKDYSFIINFHPERYPMGAPYNLEDGNTPSHEDLVETTFVTLPDEDSSPTKAWIVEHRNEPEWKAYYEDAYGKRPKEEFYDLNRDPNEMKNLADDPEYATVIGELREQLMAELTRTHDPRVIDNGKFFETPPMAGPLPDDVAKPNRTLKKK